MPIDFRAAASAILGRQNFANWANLTFGGRRNLNQILGYKKFLTYWDYRDRYARGGVAKAVVDTYPEATWRGGVEVYEDEDPQVSTEFEKSFKTLIDEFGFWQTMQQVDTLAGLCTFAVLLIGVSGDSQLSAPLPKGEQLLFLKSYAGGGGPGVQGYQQQSSQAYGAFASVAQYVTDPKDKRFGEPASYYIRNTTPGSSFLNYEVHWTRVIHVAEGCLEDNVFGVPRLECVYDLFDDLCKVTGGGSEAFWIRANQGLHLDVDKDMGLPSKAGDAASQVPGMTQPQRDALKDAAEEMLHQQQRVLVTRGVTATPFGSDVANFGPPSDALLKQIAGAARIPLRILTGSDRVGSELEQDVANFDSRVQDRRTGYAGPKMVRRTLDRLIEYGYLPKPTSYEVGWPVEENLDEVGKAGLAVQLATVNKTQGEVVFTNDEIRDMAFDMEPLKPEEKVPVGAPVRETAIAGDNPDAATLDTPLDTPQMKAALRALESAIEDDDVAGIARIIGLQDSPHKFSTTQVQLPDSFLGFGQGIPDADLDEQGRETDPHVTLKYGIVSNDVAPVRALLAGKGPITLTLGKLNYFVGEGYDVLYCEVRSENLRRLNALVSARLDVNDSHYVYTPHATIAYLKSGLAAKYVGLDTFEGQQHVASSVTFASADGERTVISVSGM